MPLLNKTALHQPAVQERGHWPRNPKPDDDGHAAHHHPGGGRREAGRPAAAVVETRAVAPAGGASGPDSPRRKRPPCAAAGLPPPSRRRPLFGVKKPRRSRRSEAAGPEQRRGRFLDDTKFFRVVQCPPRTSQKELACDTHRTKVVFLSPPLTLWRNLRTEIRTRARPMRTSISA